MAGVVNQVMAETSLSRGEAPTTISRPTGVIMEPPAPCTSRAATSSPRVWDRPHSTEPVRNSAMAVMNTRRGPKRSATQALAGTPTASARR